MAIQITRGPRGDGSPIISFVGQDSIDQQAADRFSFVQSITPQVNPLDANAVDVVDTSSTLTNGYPTYLLSGVDYTEWLDRDGNSFSSALEVVTYIQDQIGGTISILEDKILAPLAISTTINVSANTPFEFDASREGGCGYFWDNNGFPPEVEVNPLDRRKISGIMTVTGLYAVQYEVANVNGITSSTVYINVL